MVRLLTRVNIVDNSSIGQEVKALGKKVKIIHVYRKEKYPMGGLGDKVLVTVLGTMKKAFVVGCTAKQKSMIPRYDTNNVVLVDNHNVPIGTRVTCPLPNALRSKGAETARLMAIGTKFC